MTTSSKVSGRTPTEIAVCAAVIAVELAVTGAAIGVVSWRWPAVGMLALVAGWALEKQTRPAGSRHVVYAGIDRDQVVHYYGKTKAFALRAAQHQQDSRAGRNRAPRHGKDWSVLLNEGGQLVVVDRYRSELQSLRCERRMTYPAATVVYWTNRLGVLPPRVWGNRDNTSYGRNSSLRPWELAAIPLLAVLYAARPYLDPAFPQWVRWPRSNR